jgi:hypothetical protein
MPYFSGSPEFGAVADVFKYIIPAALGLSLYKWDPC